MAATFPEASALREEGWVSFLPDAFSGQLGQIWTRGRGDPAGLEVGVLASEAITNGHLGTVHGGALMTFADVALGMAVTDLLGAPTCATVSLQVQFVAAAKVGQFVTCRPEVVRRTMHLVFMRGVVEADGRAVATADGIWKAFARRPSEA